MEYKSINNFEVVVSPDNVTSSLKEVNSSRIASTTASSIRSSTNSSFSMNSTLKNNNYLYYDSDYDNTVNYSWTGTILIAFLVSIICIFSLILNCVRKNAGKAIFSGISIGVPIISIVISSVSRVFIQNGGVGIAASINTLLCIFAIMLEIIVGIISFVFCFSKDKRNM